MSDGGNVVDLAAERVKRELQQQLHQGLGIMAIVVGLSLGAVIWYFNRRVSAKS